MAESGHPYFIRYDYIGSGEPQRCGFICRAENGHNPGPRGDGVIAVPLARRQAIVAVPLCTATVLIRSTAVRFRPSRSMCGYDSTRRVRPGRGSRPGRWRPSSKVLAGMWTRWMGAAVTNATTTLLALSPLRPYAHQANAVFGAMLPVDLA